MKIVTLKFGSLSDDTKDKSLTTFFKIFIIFFGINFSLLLLSFLLTAVRIEDLLNLADMAGVQFFSFLLFAFLVSICFHYFYL